MQKIPETVRQDIIKMVPSSIVNEIVCFVFFDHHPRDQKNIDIVICTKGGEVKEYHKRDLVSSLFLDNTCEVSEIKIMRNSKCELFYFLKTGDAIFILSRRDELVTQNVITGVDKYEISDPRCTGQACLKIFRNYDAIPLVFDDNFNNISDEALVQGQFTSYDDLPLLTDLKRKLVEAKYSVKCKEKAHKDLLSLRQTSAFTSYEIVNPYFSDVFYNKDRKLEGALKIKTQKPWVKISNEKIVIVVEVLNADNVPAQNIHVMLHRTARPSLVYTTKLYEQTPSAPYWTETPSQNIEHSRETTVVAVIDLKELQHDVTSKADFNGVICYTNRGKEYLLPIENVIISASEQVDVLSNIAEENERYVILAQLVTTEKIDLCIRKIKINVGSETETDSELTMVDIFCKYLQMDKVQNSNDLIVHRSPFHTLYGIMIVFHKYVGQALDRVTVSLYTRSPSQVLALIHYVHDVVPHRIIITTLNYKITAYNDELYQYIEDTNVNPPMLNFMEYETSILKQTTMVLEHFDKCLVEMHQSKDETIRNRIGTEIDIFAGGVPDYEVFRNKMIEEASKDMKYLSDHSPNIGMEGMNDDDVFSS